MSVHESYFKVGMGFARFRNHSGGSRFRKLPRILASEIGGSSSLASEVEGSSALVASQGCGSVFASEIGGGLGLLFASENSSLVCFRNADIKG